MVEFKELRITPDGTTLIIDAAIQNLEYYNNVYIDSIVIDSQDTFISNGPSSSPIYSFVVPETLVSGSYNTEYGLIKTLRRELTVADIPTVVFKDTVFFVYIRVKGIPSASTPCGMDNITTLGVVVDLYPFYRKSINHLSQFTSMCDVSKDFLDLILRLKAFELSVQTGHYIQAIKYWNKFFKGKSDSNTGILNCGCYGSIN